ncbi:MAG TPA: sigma-70 family RNA polymerase sigma factor, partial [Nitrospirota bacterium]|nr:sigma-70 family RNA polymerase sigma factor [Nitrospirota bacterium]
MITDDAQSPVAGSALDCIARDYGRLVSSICRRMIQNEETARDAAQQVWVEVVKSFPSFRGDSKVSTWIFSIARRVALDHAVHERTYTARMIHEYSLKEEFDLPADTDLDKAVWVKQMCDRCVTGVLHCLDNESRLALIFK